jgi:hypothetical protein
MRWEEKGGESAPDVRWSADRSEDHSILWGVLATVKMLHA